ncbi:hypothetical protein ACFYQ5_09800 [Streptomyces sp. NPDC005794]|uniref:hypothetical protein n=1 Tax=Streptomyces sp. NPDC005794 TaxID=3364733 RepID=UPI0036CB4BE7
MDWTTVRCRSRVFNRPFGSPSGAGGLHGAYSGPAWGVPRLSASAVYVSGEPGEDSWV